MATKDEPNNIKDQVRNALRSQKVKLWTPPYVTDATGEPVVSALEQLAKAWNTNQILQATDEDLPSVVQALQDWQAHALAKLKTKRKTPSPTNAHSSINLEIKILGWKGEPVAVVPNEDFCQSVQVDTPQKNLTVIRLEGVSTLKTDVQLLDCLYKFFPSSAGIKPSLRMIHRGKNIGGSNNETLALVLGQSIGSSSSSDAVVPLLCLVSSVDPAEEARVNLNARIAAIRDAASKIRGVGNVELTDQHGNTVPMTKEERLGFVTALALHRLGLAATSFTESLVLLLEADVEWNDHPNLSAWKDRVDNYGLLQLDIAWIYLQLESLDNLPDSIKRLEEAERVLRKQVHKNFVALATTQAEMGNAKEVPPLAAVFAKLFLLQGIAYLCDCNENRDPASAQKSRERLDQAFVLLQCLRSMTPKESVQQLLEVMGSSANTAAYAATTRRRFTASDAIAALRKSQGDMDAAALTLSQEETKRRQLKQDREIQHQQGLCQNERDPVDLAHVETLKPLLKGNDSADQNAILDTALADLAIGLLRLADNNIDGALKLYAQQDYDAYKVYNMVDALDQTLVRKGLLGRSVLRAKKKKRKLYDAAAGNGAQKSANEPPRRRNGSGKTGEHGSGARQG